MSQDGYLRDNQLGLFTTKHGGYGRCFETSTLDVESNDFEEMERLLKSLVSKMEAGFSYKFYLKAESQKEFPTEISRTEALKRVGAIRYRAFLVVTVLPSFLHKLKLIYQSFTKNEFSLDKHLDSHLRDLRIFDEPFKASPISEAKLDEIVVGVQKDANKTIKPPIIDYGHVFHSAVSLNATSTDPLDFERVSEALCHLTPPYTICYTLSPYSTEISEAKVRALSNRWKNGLLAQNLDSYSAEELLSKVCNEGQRLFDMEYVVGISRSCETECRLAITEFEHRLEKNGDFSRSFYNLEFEHGSLYAAGDMANPITEVEECVPIYNPIVLAGKSNIESQKDHFVFHRKNDSLDGFDLFDQSYANFSACIFGKSGSGKSVLTNLLTRSLLNDPMNKIIKVDVGGSHSKETAALGGEEFRLTMSEPSGINPFRTASELDDIDSATNVLSNFLSVLILENGEIEISKQTRSELENALSQYLSQNPQTPSLSDFLKSGPGIPRKDLLARWGDRGVYKNAFKEKPKTQKPQSHLRYFNFSEIFQASDPDYGQGGFAAIMAQFNFEMMKKDGSRLIFMADETPFFINRCFSFFKFSTANVRKFGGSFITIAQNSSDVVVGGDTGIIDNSNTKFLFSIDGQPEAFQKRLSLNSRQIYQLESLKREPGRYSEALLTDGLSSKVIRLRVSPEEYWSVTSSHKDKSIIENLIQTIPGLTEEEAVRCLAAAY